MKRTLLVATAIFLAQPVLGQSETTILPSFVGAQDLFNQNCAICHGATGNGDGVLATQFTPRPRNLALGTFRFRSTDLGEPPAQEDLKRTITNGIEGSYGRSMPAFDELTPGEITSLTNYVKDLAGFDEFGVSIDIPARPAEKNVTLGRQLFIVNGCIECHGDAGDGTGILAAELRDEDNNSIRPANLQVGAFKGGNAPEDIFLRINFGIDGTPMPSFGRNLTSEEVWALTDYVLALSEPD